MRHEAVTRRHLTTRVLLGLRVLATLCVIVPLLAAPSIANFAIATAAALLIAGSFVRWSFLLLIETPEVVPAPAGIRVAAVTTYVPGAESLAMVERTLTAMAAMTYPHDTWLLDEGDSPDAARMCARLGVRHFSRRHKPHYQSDSGAFQRATKHGNYNAWLAEVGFSRYDVLAAIDPDHIPRPSFLEDTLGQLAPDDIAYVQSPQDYYNQDASFIARGCSEESRDFYWITQPAYHHYRTPSVIGAHGVHKVSVLNAVGGLAPHVADDLLLTLHYQMAGWRGAYVPKVLAVGLAPVDWATYVKQQRRWARSLFDVKLRLYPHLARNLPLHTRVVGFLQGLSYLQDALAALAWGVALCAVLVSGVPASWMSPAFLVPVTLGVVLLVVTGLYPHAFHGPYRNLGFYWRAALLRAVKWPYTLLALADVVGGRRREYDLTDKHDTPSAVDWSLYWPHVVTCTLVAALWALAASLDRVQGVLPSVLALAAVLPSLLLLVSSLFRAPPGFDATRADSAPDDQRR